MSVGRRVLAEAFGTAALVFVGPGAAMLSASTQVINHLGVSIAFGVIVALLVLLLGPISGAHINPAVTLTFWWMKRFPRRDVVPYVVAQCAGAMAAAFLLRALLGDVGHVGATIPSVSTVTAFIIEFAASALLAFVIFALASPRDIPALVPPLTIGATVFVGAYVTGPWTGGSLNPARSFGPAVASHTWTAHWIYWLAPITGMLAGAQYALRVRATRGTKRTGNGQRSEKQQTRDH